ncbi:MAG: hypothetical protein CM15mP32_5080 [Flavobacteriaceae bacterium]|nr:MAG: hypothetical protein CM15mP32_5080 [Flavobacteriaceae bacterium]
MTCFKGYIDYKPTEVLLWLLSNFTDLTFDPIEEQHPRIHDPE